jgi:hypothetical protein
VISIKGDDCRLEFLGVLPDTTGGAIGISLSLSLSLTSSVH